MRIRINSEWTDVEAETTIAAVVKQRAPSNPALAVAVNETLVPRGQHDTWQLREGDSVEIVSPQAGG